MTYFIPSIAAAGMLLILFGAPRGSIQLERRVLPYLGRGGQAPRRSWLGSLLERLVPGGDRDLADKLALVHPRASVANFRVEQAVWALSTLAFSMATLAVIAASGVAVATRAVPMLGILAFAIGWTCRRRRLESWIQRRREAIGHALPGVIELLTLTLLAGQSVVEGLERVARTQSGPLGDELQRISGSVRSGEPLVHALEQFRRRSDHVAADRLVTALITAIERGAPLASVLRDQAEDGRKAFRWQLLEAAGRKEIAMLIPVVFLILPVIVVVALFPAFVSLNQVL